MKKLKVLFDAEILISVWAGQSIGTGIYYTAYNIFQQLLLRNDIDVYIYSSKRNFGRLRYALENKFPELYQKQIKLDYISELYARWQYCWFSCEKKRKKTIFIKMKQGIIRNLLQRPIKTIASCFKTYRHIADSFDCYFSPLYKVPWYVEDNKNIKKFIILYDAIPLLFPDISIISSSKSWYMNLIRQINKQNYYFAISECAKADFIQNVPQIDKNKLSIIPLAANSNFYPDYNLQRNQSIRKKYCIPLNRRYFLSVCTIEPRKNLIFAISNYLNFIKKNNIIDLVLVLAGGHWKKLSPEVVAAINELGFKDRIIQTGYVDERDLASLYSNAECFVYPSLYEGFGLPPLEAMQCGTPVITSNTSSLPEVVGDAAIMIDPHDNDALIKAYEKIYFDGGLRKELSQKGIKRAKIFSWQKCTDIIVNKMKEVSGEL